MKLGKLLPAIMLMILAGSASAQSTRYTVTDAMVAQCVRETRAPGSYELVRRGQTKLVKASASGTVRGAHNVNDCLQDKLQMQYGSVTVAERPVNPVADECRRTRNQRIGLGLALTAGVVTGLGASEALVYSGVAGSIAGIASVNRDYRKCRIEAGTVRVSGSNIPHNSCRNGGSVMQGGTSYCRR